MKTSPRNLSFYRCAQYYLLVSSMRVRVQRIESVRDLEGNLGKRIELVQEETTPRFAIRPASEEARMVQDMIRVLQQQIPLFSIQSQITMPKIILFLTEREYEELGVDFDVNQVYDVELSNQTIRFRKAY
ncbi:MAG: arcadin 1 [Candidatus Bathyarchaeia archaeon]